MKWLYSTDNLGFGDAQDYYPTCPSDTFVIGAACGVRDASDNDPSIIVDYVGPSNQDGQLASNPPTQARCSLSNNFGPSTAIAYAVGCLSVTAPTSSAAAVYKSCSYNPDTETPCTEADAVVTDPKLAADLGSVLSQTASAAPATPGTTPVKKHTRKVTLWFRN